MLRGNWRRTKGGNPRLAPHPDATGPRALPLGFASYSGCFLGGLFMPDDQTLAMILAICDLIKHNGNSVETAVEAYERAMKSVIDYRRSKGLTEVGGLPGGYNQ
jgi:hypothetical protein